MFRKKKKKEMLLNRNSIKIENLVKIETRRDYIQLTAARRSVVAYRDLTPL